MKEKFLKEQQEKKLFSGVSIDFLEELKAEKLKNREYLRKAVKELKEKLVEYKKMANDTENAIMVARFEIGEDREYMETTKRIIETYDQNQKNRHEVIIDLLNRISRLSKFKKWRESWGTVGTDFARANIAKWANEMADYLESSKKIKNKNA